MVSLVQSPPRDRGRTEPIAPHIEHKTVGEILKKANLDEFLKAWVFGIEACPVELAILHASLDG